MGAKRMGTTKLRRIGHTRWRYLLTLGLMVTITFAATCVMLGNAATPKEYLIKEGDIAVETITATRDIEDTITTNLLREAARNSVVRKFKQDDSITVEVLGKLNDAFEAIDTVQTMAAEERERLTKIMQNNAAPGEIVGNPSDIQFGEIFLDKCRDILTLSFSKRELNTVLSMTDSEYALLYDVLVRQMADAMKNGIKEEYLKEQNNKIAQELANPLNGLSTDLQRVGLNIVSTYLKANFIYDAAATENDRRTAEQAVEPVVYKKGQNIVLAGEVVRPVQIELIRKLGMLGGSVNYQRIYLGVILFALLVFAAAGVYAATFDRKFFRDLKLVSIFCLIYLAVLALCWQIRLLTLYIVPISVAAMLTTILINRRMAVLINLMLTMLVCSMWMQDASVSIIVSVAAASLMGGTIAICAIFRSPQRATFVTVGFLLGLMSAAAFASLDIINMVEWIVLLRNALLAFLGGLVSSILCLGILPMLEIGFRMVTPIRILEYTNPNQPLLKRLLMEAPGTYHHSIIVGNMAEQAAEAVGANPLLARAGAFYHDIGKVMRPIFFRENQVGPENPHDGIEPTLSARIIISHVTDGLDLAKRYKLPKVIQDIIAQHHGNSMVTYFYHKAKTNAAEEEEVQVEDYRYEGPRPQSKEAAIIMLADSVEAAVRTIRENNLDRIEATIRKVIKSKLDDGQLDQCELTLHDMDTIIRIFRSSLNGIYHERIEYPDMDKPVRYKKVKEKDA